VEAAALTTHVPVIGGSWTMGVHVSGGATETEGSSKVAWVGPGFFRTLAIPLLSGRDIARTDMATSPKVALVNETFVRRLLGGRNPIGARARTGAEPGYPESTYEIVGVVKDTKYGSLRGEIPPILFAPASQVPTANPVATVVVRTSAPLAGIMAATRQRIASLGAEILMGTQVLQTQISEGLARERLVAWLSGFFGVLAVVLVVVGLYGLVSYTTLLRRNELGVRLALGAQKGNILWLVLGQGLRLACLGIFLGLIGAVGLTRLLGTLLFDLKPTDATTLLATSLLLVVVATLACLFPARRAANADPMSALRHE